MRNRRRFRASGTARLSPALGENREIRAARLSLSAWREKRALRRPLARLDSIKAGSVVAALFQRGAEKLRCADFSLLTNGAGLCPRDGVDAAPRVAVACRVAVLMLSAFVLAACAPTLHLDAPTMPTLEMPPATARCTKDPVKTLAKLDPPPQLPDARQSPCPLGSGLAACFTLDQDIMRQQRFKILHDDRDYCRDAYQRAITPWRRGRQ